MIRTQIQLPPDQHRALKRWASERDISLSEAVRRCVAAQLERDAQGGGWPARVREAMGVVGRYADPEGPSSVARKHDEHLDEAYGA